MYFKAETDSSSAWEKNKHQHCVYPYIVETTEDPMNLVRRPSSVCSVFLGKQQIHIWIILLLVEKNQQQLWKIAEYEFNPELNQPEMCCSHKFAHQEISEVLDMARVNFEFSLKGLIINKRCGQLNAKVAYWPWRLTLVELLDGWISRTIEIWKPPSRVRKAFSEGHRTREKAELHY